MDQESPIIPQEIQLQNSQPNKIIAEQNEISYEEQLAKVLSNANISQLGKTHVYEPPRNPPPLVKNRRFMKLKQLRQSQYFEQQAIKLRHPQLYYIYVGKYRAKDEHRDTQTMNQQTISGFLQQHLVNQQYRELLKMNKAKILTEEQKDDVQAHVLPQQMNSQNLSIQEQNLINVCQLIFLNGQQKNFDYQQVDLSQEYDDIKLKDQDEEQRYLEQQQPNQISQESNIYTGIQDY